MFGCLLRGLFPSWQDAAEASPSDSDDDVDPPSSCDEPTKSFFLFDNLNNDCKIHVLSFLSSDEMNSFAICSHGCRRLRAGESLDQTRTATLVCTETTTLDSFYNTVIENRHVFTGNRTRLKVASLERKMLTRIVAHISRQDAVRSVIYCDPFEHVTSLDLSIHTFPTVENRQLSEFLHVLDYKFPNLQTLDLSNMPSRAVGSYYRRGFFSEYCSSLNTIVWKNCDRIWFDGYDFENVAASLTHLDLDGSMFSATVAHEDPQFQYFLLMKCKHLERLSITDATLMRPYYGKQTLPQDVIINMVRMHPKLQWLRSDLTAENVEMLKQERPHITFVSG